jgi:hypothetical protein
MKTDRIVGLNNERGLTKWVSAIDQAIRDRYTPALSKLIRSGKKNLDNGTAHDSGLVRGKLAEAISIYNSIKRR